MPPTYQLLVTPPNGSQVDYTQYMRQTDWSISQSWGRQADTAIIELYEEHAIGGSNIYIPPLSVISLEDTSTNVFLFTGQVNNPKVYYESPIASRFELNCCGWIPYAAKSQVTGTFSGMYAGEIVLALIPGGSAYGLNASAISSGGYVNNTDGPLLGVINFQNITLQDALTQIAQFASTSEVWGWSIDHARNIIFGPPSNSTVASFTDEPSAIGTTTTGGIQWDGQFTYEWDATDIRNAIVVTGKSLTRPQTDKFIGNGSTVKWSLSYQISSGSTVVMSVGSSRVSVGLAPASGPPTTEFQYFQDANGVFWIENGTYPVVAAGSKISIRYSYPSAILTQVLAPYVGLNPYNGPNNGLYSEYVSDSTIGDLSSARARGYREITEYGYAQERINFTTTPDFLGHVRGGDTIQVTLHNVRDSQNSYVLGFTDSFVVTQVNCQARMEGAGYRQYVIEAARMYI